MRTLLAAGLACLTLTACDSIPVEREEFEKTVPLDRGGSFRLENVNGRVDLETWDRAEVEIRAVKRATRPQEIEIQVQASPQEVSVRTVLPRASWSFEHRSHVDYTVRLPASVRLDLQDTNGTVAVKDPGGRVSASTVNGTITVLGALADVRATATNGTVKVSCTRVQPDGIYELSTTNGKVELVVPRDVGGHFEGSTVNGWIETDLPLSVSGKLLSHRLSGQIGAGGASFRLSTVNGLVAVRKTRS